MKSNGLVQDCKWISWFRLFLLGTITLLCFMEAVCHAENLKAQRSVFNFTAAGRQGGMDCAGARSAQEQNLKREVPLEFVNWTQAEGLQVSSPDLGTMESCGALLLCGRSDLLFPGYAVLNLEEQDLCLISSTLSEKLFGGADTYGLMVEVQGREMKVLDVIDSEEEFVVYEAGEYDDCLLDRAAVRCIPGEFGKTEEGYRQLCGEWERIEDRVLVWITQGVCVLVPFVLWIYLIWYCRCMPRNAEKAERTSFGGKKGDAGRAECVYDGEPCGYTGRTDRLSAGGMRGYDRYEKMIWYILSYLLLAGGILLLFRRFQIPEDMIPTRWSDFEFWTEYGKRLGESCRVLIRSEKRIPDIPMLEEFARTLQWAAGAVVGETVFLGIFKK